MSGVPRKPTDSGTQRDPVVSLRVYVYATPARRPSTLFCGCTVNRSPRVDHRRIRNSKVAFEEIEDVSKAIIMGGQQG
jgi:hypothetical protein